MIFTTRRPDQRSEVGARVLAYVVEGMEEMR